MTIAQATAAAYAADEAFSAAVKAAGFRDRWQWHMAKGPESVTAAYRAKIAADEAMHAAFRESYRAS